MTAHPIEILLMNLAIAGAAQRARIEAANAIGAVAGRFDVTDLPSWPLPTAALYNSLRAKRAWDTVMAVGTAVVKLGGHETMSENRMTLVEKDLACRGDRDAAIAALIARRGITVTDAAEIVERWLPRSEVYAATIKCTARPGCHAGYLESELAAVTTSAELQTILPWVFALEDEAERQIARAAYHGALQRISTGAQAVP